MERDAQALALGRPVDSVCEDLHAAPPDLCIRSELEAVLAHVDEALDADDALRVFARAAADACHQAVPVGEPLQLGTRLLGDGCVLGPGHDRRERSVHVK
jgi:hypothetical protein